MQEQLISFETAKLAKEKGFNINKKYNNYSHSEYYYDNSYILTPLMIHGNKATGSLSLFENIYDAPTQSLLQRWLREAHKLHLNVVYSHDHNKYSVEGFDQFHADELRKRNPRSEGRLPYPYKSKFKEHCWVYNSYEESLEKGLQEALKLIK